MSHPQSIPASDPLSRVYSFPADSNFWKVLVQEARMYPGATRAPHFHVDCPDIKIGMLVNKNFLRQFVIGWEKANPHVVVMKDARERDTTYHGSKEFWGGDGYVQHGVTDFEQQYARDTELNQDPYGNGYGNGQYSSSASSSPPQGDYYNGQPSISSAFGQMGDSTRCAHCGSVTGSPHGSGHYTSISPQNRGYHHEGSPSYPPSQHQQERFASASASPRHGTGPSGLSLDEKLARARAEYSSLRRSQQPSPRSAVNYAAAQSSPRYTTAATYSPEPVYQAYSPPPVQVAPLPPQESDLERRVRALEIGVENCKAELEGQRRSW